MIYPNQDIFNFMIKLHQSLLSTTLYDPGTIITLKEDLECVVEKLMVSHETMISFQQNILKCLQKIIKLTKLAEDLSLILLEKFVNVYLTTAIVDMTNYKMKILSQTSGLISFNNLSFRQQVDTGTLKSNEKQSNSKNNNNNSNSNNNNKKSNNNNNNNNSNNNNNNNKTNKNSSNKTNSKSTSKNIELWVQCDNSNCNKWSKYPEEYKNKLPKGNWFCKDAIWITNHHVRDCLEEVEEEDNDDDDDDDDDDNEDKDNEDDVNEDNDDEDNDNEDDD